MSKYQVILIRDSKTNRNYFYSYTESEDITLGNIELTELPPYSDTNKARACYLVVKSWVFDEAKYNEILANAEAERINALVTISNNEKLQLLADAIIVDEAPTENGVVLPKKLGYTWEKKCVITNGVPHISWQLVKDVQYKPVNDGSDYLKAIDWTVGDSVIEGLWYNVGNDYIWQSIKTGVPSSAEDKTYFDIP